MGSGERSPKPPRGKDALHARLAHLMADNARLGAENSALILERASASMEIRRFQKIADNAPALIAVIDAKALSYIFVNIEYADVCGRSRDLIIGRHMREILGADVFSRIESCIERVRLGQNIAYEDAFETAVGRRWLHVTYRPIYDGDGQIADFVVMSWDITKLKLAQEKIHALLEDKETLLVELEKLAITDPLTGAFNRRHFCEVGIHEMARSRRTGCALSIIMFDLDHFKKINDAYGHHIGDEVLKTVVARLRQVLRENDVLGRLGGEEFFILLPDTTSSEAEATAERCRMLIESIDSVLVDENPIHFTASFGIGQIGVGMDDFGNVLQQVDAALYKAKAAGRNCVIRVG